MGQTAPLVSVLRPPRHPTWAPPRSALRSHARYLRSGTRRLPPPETSRLGGRASKLPPSPAAAYFFSRQPGASRFLMGSYSAETPFCKAHATGRRGGEEAQGYRQALPGTSGAADSCARALPPAPPQPRPLPSRRASKAPAPRPPALGCGRGHGLFPPPGSCFGWGWSASLQAFHLCMEGFEN